MAREDQSKRERQKDLESSDILRDFDSRSGDGNGSGAIVSRPSDTGTGREGTSPGRPDLGKKAQKPKRRWRADAKSIVDVAYDSVIFAAMILVFVALEGLLFVGWAWLNDALGKLPKLIGFEPTFFYYAGKTAVSAVILYLILDHAVDFAKELRETHRERKRQQASGKQRGDAQ